MQIYSIIEIVIIFPLIILIHEIGHAFFTIIFGGQVKKIIIGIGGKKIFSFGIFEVHSFFFLGGQCQCRRLTTSRRFTEAVMIAGGVIFNTITIILGNFLGKLYNPEFMHTFNTDAPSILLRQFISCSIFVAVFNILPGTYFNINLDGKQLYQLLRYGSSKLYGDVEV